MERVCIIITLKTLDASIISLILLFFILLNAYNRSEEIFLSYKLFIYLILINMLLIVIDILGWAFNGLPGNINLFYNNFFNLLLYVIEPIPAALWLVYIKNQIFYNNAKIKKLTIVLCIFLIINCIFSFLSIHTGWFFYIDNNNIYSRGPYFGIHVAFCLGLIFYALFTIVSNKRLIETRYYISLLLFFVPQLIGSTIQLFIYGVSYNWLGAAFSTLIVQFNFQNRGLSLDYLTSVYNRRKLDEYIKCKISSSNERRSFSGLLIDLNYFKLINDEFGHNMGDQALKSAVEILKTCLDKNDFIARYGGDEFVVILNINNLELLKDTVHKIQFAVEEFNNKNENPYKLSFSIGFDIYDGKSKPSPEEFLKNIDINMYNAKNSRKL